LVPPKRIEIPTKHKPWRLTEDEISEMVDLVKGSNLDDKSSLIIRDIIEYAKSEAERR
jgi:hypothetical protein